MIVPYWLQSLSRVDFLHSVGLYVMRDRIVFVRLRKNFLRLSLVEQETCALAQEEGQSAVSELTGWIAEDVREIALKAENDSHERALRQAILSLVPHISIGRDAVYVCVPQDQAVVQQMFFPQAAESNLQQVLEYEIERQLPFRRDEIFYDFLATGRSGDKVGLCLFAIPKKTLATLLEVLGSFGIKPRGIETTVTAMANYLLFCNGESSEASTVIGAHNKSWEVVGVQSKKGGWKPIYQLLFTHWLPDYAWSQGGARDLLQKCLGRASRLYRWGESPSFPLCAADDEAPQYEDLVTAGGQRLRGGVEIAHPDVLPAIGAALRGVREASFETNLLRREGSDKGHGKALSIINGILGTLLVLGAIGWGASYPIKDELRLRQLQQENQKLEPSVAALRGEETQLQKARKELLFLTDLESHRGEVLRILDDLSKNVPSNAYFSNLRYRNGVLEAQGSAENASALIPLLERSPVFENVGFNAPSNRGRDNRETFSLKAELEKPKAKTKEAVEEKAKIKVQEKTTKP